MDPVTVGGVVTVIGSMTTTTKTIMEIVKTARSKSKNPEVERSLSEALEQIFSLQAGMIDLQTKILNLQEENSQLRDKIRQEEERAKDREQYERKEIRGSVVLVRAEEPNNYYCQSCFQTKKRAILLQKMAGVFSIIGSHVCPGCKQHYALVE